ncbi:hypothetical protein MRB53_008565 [Persea americana]|uniref:Uncharacterized protein n=1 Tax=Persea americana TaxID=3435 RepID=A0ACC2MNX2_PERAE|nr:hypothetical protein MRB53_008565 [Persea americana]
MKHNNLSLRLQFTVRALRIYFKERHSEGFEGPKFQVVTLTESSPVKFQGYVKGSLENDGCRCCCVNFNCVAVFCECFRAGEYCAEGCLDCRNNPANEDMIHDLRRRKESFIPLPLKRKLVQLATLSTQNSWVRTFDKMKPQSTESIPSLILR